MGGKRTTNRHRAGLLLLAATLGCYESHGLTALDDETTDGRDVADDGPAREDVVDGGDGDGPRPPSGVERLGGPVQLDDETLAGGTLGVAWDGEGWGVLWPDDRPRTVVFRRLSADLGRLGSVRALGPSVTPQRTVLARGPDRYAVAWSADGRTSLATLDDDGRLLAGPTEVGASQRDIDLAWWPAGGTWLLAWGPDSGGDGAYELQVLPFDDELRAGDALPYGERSSFLSGTRLATAGPWLGVAWSGSVGNWFRARRPDDPGPGPPPLSVPRASADDWDLEPPVSVGWGEAFVLATLEGTGPAVTTVDGASGAVVAGPRVVGASPMLQRRPGLQAVPEHGVLGLCYQTGPYHFPGSGGHDGLEFRLVSAAAEPIGEPVVLASELHMICDCALGWSGRELLAVWWSCGGDRVFNTVWGQRLRIVP